MKKETTALAKALENLIVAILNGDNVVPQEVPAPVAPVVPQEVLAPEPVAPIVRTPVAQAPIAPVVQVTTMTHDEARAQLLPIIQSNQGAMTAVHGVLTGQFQVNELTSLPVASIVPFMEAVNAALAALPKQ